MPAWAKARSAAGLIAVSVSDGAYVMVLWVTHSPAPSNHAAGRCVLFTRSGCTTTRAAASVDRGGDLGPYEGVPLGGMISLTDRRHRVGAPAADEAAYRRDVGRQERQGCAVDHPIVDQAVPQSPHHVMPGA